MTNQNPTTEERLRETMEERFDKRYNWKEHMIFHPVHEDWLPNDFKAFIKSELSLATQEAERRILKDIHEIVEFDWVVNNKVLDYAASKGITI